MKKKRKRHAPEQIVKKLRDADVMLNTGKSLEEVLKVLEVSEATLARWRSQYGGMKSEEAKAAIEAGSELADVVGEVERFLVDEQVLELKGHGSKTLKERVV